MADVAIDQEARDLVRDALAVIRQHVAICEERENRRQRVEAERDKRQDQFLESLESKIAGIQRGYDSAYRDISGRLNTDVNTLATSIQKLDGKVDAAETRYGSRFWTLAVTMIVGLLAAIWSIIMRKTGLG